MAIFGQRILLSGLDVGPANTQTENIDETIDTNDTTLLEQHGELKQTAHGVIFSIAVTYQREHGDRRLDIQPIG